MKSILIASTVSFLAIFAGLYLYSAQQAKQAADAPGTALSADDIDAAELTFAALEAEREQLHRERTRLINRTASIAARETSLQDQRKLIDRAIADLREAQEAFGQARSDNAQKLAKMFDSIKPADAAQILPVLDRETAIDILERMKAKSAAKLLAELDPRLAADLSTRLSVRGAR